MFSSEDRKLLSACKARKTKPGLTLILATPLTDFSGGLALAFKETSAVCWYGPLMLVNSSDAHPAIISAGRGSGLKYLLEGLFPSVCPDVIVECCGTSEGTTAVAALERPVAGVRNYVVPQL